SLVSEKFNDYAIADVVVSEEDIVATYDAHVAADTADFADSRTYTSARNGGETLYYNPEGYRQVKQVLIKFDDTQSAAYSDLSATLTSLEAEMDAILNPVEEEATEEEATEEAAEPRTVEEVQADIDAVNAEIEALYAELMPTVEEVITAFNNGTAFADLIAQYNQDPGMMNEPTATLGYPVSADSASYDPAFKDAAMSIENIGEIAEPARGSYGIYIVYYDADIVSGAVDMESVRTVLEEETLISMQTEAVNALVDEWVAAINPVYFYENMK
ncbi:MAG: peptidylprolyl isomerase, partial [Clostridia bacterium]|nr:peptidylprolyl isomerase [Clostridia bacterium]